MGYDIFRDSQYAPLPVEFDPIGGIGRKLDCTRFCPEAGHYISRVIPVTQRTCRTGRRLLAYDTR